MSRAEERSHQISSHLDGDNMVSTWDPDRTSFPTRKDLPSIPGAPEGAAWFWGKDDNIGRLNLLTPTRVKAAAAHIKTGALVPVNLSLLHPTVPAFHREPFVHTIKCVVPGVCFDDQYALNTQSGTQWDGFRHFAHVATNTFYNGTKHEDIQGPHANLKCSVHWIAQHGIAGRGLLLDHASWAAANGKSFDPNGYDGIPYEDLVAVGKAQGIDIRPASQGGDVHIGDMLFVRSGWVKSYASQSEEERARLATRHQARGPENEMTYSGLAQEEAIVDWLHDCYFAAVAGDSPTFEAWPSKTGQFLHEHLLALWGVPIGEMLDLEKLAETCRAEGRWFFFFSSNPANVPGGVASHVNGQAIF